ncbi:hypothetical protein [Methylobacterium fujisawaense]|uniref:hypothetical protein n=1 Tax=Methylobacterium fujisawaense TaxID=107400 RepID=UPI00313B9EAF
MNAIKGRFLAIGIAVVLVGTERLLEAADLKYAFEDCVVAAVAAAIAVAPADLRS